MTYLLDTNVVSELARPRPDPAVAAWIKAASDAPLHLSVLSLGEIRRGVDSLEDGVRRERLRRWLERDVVARFEGRLLPVDVAVAERWGRLLAEVGTPVPAIDSLIAATALQHHLRLVTRNVSDFRRFAGLDLIDPWSRDAPSAPSRGG